MSDCLEFVAPGRSFLELVCNSVVDSFNTLLLLLFNRCKYSIPAIYDILFEFFYHYLMRQEIAALFLLIYFLLARKLNGF